MRGFESLMGTLFEFIFTYFFIVQYLTHAFHIFSFTHFPDDVSKCYQQIIVGTCKNAPPHKNSSCLKIFVLNCNVFDDYSCLCILTSPEFNNMLHLYGSVLAISWPCLDHALIQKMSWPMRNSDVTSRHGWGMVKHQLWGGWKSSLLLFYHILLPDVRGGYFPVLDSHGYSHFQCS